MIVIQILIQRWRNRAFIVYLLVVLTSVYLVVSVAASVAFYYFNGYFPNYYTLEYFRTEPRSAFLLLRDSISLVNISLFLLCGIILVFIMKWVLFMTKRVTRKRGLLICGGIYFFSFAFLMLRQKKFDQCYTMDTNFSVAFVRHVFELGRERKFQGRGLGYRKPVVLSKEKGKCNFNVLVILCESLRRQNLGLYGYNKNTTPQLDRFVYENKESTFLFKEAYSVSSTTMLAVPAILSGIAPYQSSDMFYRQPLIWEFGRSSRLRTFFLSSHTMEWYHFDRYYEREHIDYKWNKETSGKPFFNDLGIDDAFTIKELNRLLTKKSRFFGVVQLNTTHYPYHVPSCARKWNGTFEDEYNNAIRYQDSLLGSVFDQLKRERIIENTVIILTSDHGESLKDHHSMGHVDSYYTEAISIPLIFYLPEKIRKDLNCMALTRNKRKTVSNIDIAPTIIDLLDMRGQLKEKDLLDAYSGFSLFKEIPEDRTLITMNNNEVALFKVGISVLGSGWHYIHRMNIVPHRQELYATKWDKKEKINLFGRTGKQQLMRFFKELKKYDVCIKYLPEFHKSFN